MKKIYERVITHIGDFIEESLEDSFFILFNANAPEEYREYCVLHEGADLKDDIKIGDKFVINGAEYSITSVGNVVKNNLAELGHITVKFDGASISEQPGTLHIEKIETVKFMVGDKIEIISL